MLVAEVLQPSPAIEVAVEGEDCPTAAVVRLCEQTAASTVDEEELDAVMTTERSARLASCFYLPPGKDVVAKSLTLADLALARLGGEGEVVDLVVELLWKALEALTHGGRCGSHVGSHVSGDICGALVGGDA